MNQPATHSDAVAAQPDGAPAVAASTVAAPAAATGSMSRFCSHGRQSRQSSESRRALPVAAAALAGLLVLAAAAPALHAQQQQQGSEPFKAEVNAPVRNFRLPVFDEQGHRQWDLQGAQAEYINRNEIRVDDMTLRTYAKSDPLNPRMLIQSPSAQIHPVDSIAAGPGYLYITEANNNYFIIGRNWVWDGRGQKVSIKSDVRVTFREKMDNMLAQ